MENSVKSQFSAPTYYHKRRQLLKAVRVVLTGGVDKFKQSHSLGDPKVNGRGLYLRLTGDLSGREESSFETSKGGGRAFPETTKSLLKGWRLG